MPPGAGSTANRPRSSPRSRCFKHEACRRDAEPRAGDRIGQPMRIVIHARVRRADGEPVAERAPQPTMPIVAGFREHRADGECRRRVQRRERVAILAPRIRVGRRVGTFALRELLERVARGATERGSLEHRAGLAPPTLLIADDGCDPRAAEREHGGSGVATVVRYRASCPGPRLRYRSARARRRRIGARTQLRRASRRNAPTAGVAPATAQ